MAAQAPTTPIKPSDINTQQHFWDAFGHRETEVSANWIVRYCQERNNDTWEPFSLRDLQKFYSEGRGREERFLFNRLTSMNYVSVDGDTVSVTTRFVAQCHGSSPTE